MVNHYMYELYKQGASFKHGDALCYAVKNVCNRKFTQSSHFIRFTYHSDALCGYTVFDGGLNYQSGTLPCPPMLKVLLYDYVGLCDITKISYHIIGNIGVV